MAFYEVVLNWTTSAGEFKNVLHYDVANASPEGFEAMVGNIAGEWGAHIATLQPSTVGFEGISVREDIAGGVAFDYPAPSGPLYGTAVDDNFLGQAAVLVKKLHNGSTRPQQGRIYVPGITTEFVTDQSAWTNAARDAVQDFVDGILFIDDLSTGIQATMYIKAADPTRPNTNAYNIVSQVQGINAVTTLRSRKRGVGS